MIAGDKLWKTFVGLGGCLWHYRRNSCSFSKMNNRKIDLLSTNEKVLVFNCMWFPCMPKRHALSLICFNCEPSFFHFKYSQAQGVPREYRTGWLQRSYFLGNRAHLSVRNSWNNCNNPWIFNMVHKFRDRKISAWTAGIAVLPTMSVYACFCKRKSNGKLHWRKSDQIWSEGKE